MVDSHYLNYYKRWYMKRTKNYLFMKFQMERRRMHLVLQSGGRVLFAGSRIGCMILNCRKSGTSIERSAMNR